eukprot:1146420-Pelagomonas_calceolata.AAC.1
MEWNLSMCVTRVSGVLKVIVKVKIHALERALREEPVKEHTNHPDSSKFLERCKCGYQAIKEGCPKSPGTLPVGELRFFNIPKRVV